MRKVYATVIYKNLQIVNISVVTLKGSHIDLTCSNSQYKTFSDLYRAVLKTLKNNGFYVSYENMFDSRCYNIGFIDYNNPSKVNYMFLKEV